MSTERKPWICPACGVGCAPHVDHCGNCAFKAAMKPLDDAMEQAKKMPPAPVEAWPPPWEYPITIPGTVPAVPCMFDNLPPGVYGLACNCPRCTPQCVSVPSVFDRSDQPTGATSYTLTAATVTHGQRIGGTQRYA